MNHFRFFDHIDRVLAEPRSPYLRKDGAVWPSEASAPALEWVGDAAPPAGIYGKCHRAAFFSMSGTTVNDPASPKGVRRMMLGSAVEDLNVSLAADAGLFVASQIKIQRKIGIDPFAPEDSPDRTVTLPLALDLIVLDPADSHRPYICEIKSFYGYYAKKELIGQNKPKVENLMQVVMYYHEVGTGARLKEFIRQNLAAKVSAMRRELVPMPAQAFELFAAEDLKRPLDELHELHESLGAEFRFRGLDRKPGVRVPRLKYNYDNVAKMNEGEVEAKLTYEARDDGSIKEFDVGLALDSEVGKYFPTVDGQFYPLFSLEGLYERFGKLSAHWKGFWAIVVEEARKLKLDPASVVPAEQEKLRLLSERLALDHLPPAEYRFRYDAQEIEQMLERGQIGKKAYADWKKGLKQPGAWQCSYCDYKSICVPREYPDLRLAVNSLRVDDDEEDS